MNHISELRQLGTSTWLDDLSRERLVSGNLKEIIPAKSIVCLLYTSPSPRD